MANFCPKCGQQVRPEDVFCLRCGTRLDGMPGTDNTEAVTYIAQPSYQMNATSQQNYYLQMNQTPVYAGNGAVREGIPQPGFSDRVNHPEILAAVNKTRRISMLSTFFIVPIPLIGFFIYASVTEKMEISEAIRYGGIVSLIFLAFAVYSFIKSRPAKTYEAVVTNRYTRERADKSTDTNSRGQRPSKYDYITVARTTDGKTKKIVETDHSRIWAYDHLKVGDRFRYHPQFAFPYELYDKTQADALYCVACGTKNPVTADRCKRCNVPLLK